MIISEIYKCAQMEGALMGTPSILIRLSTCNLRCSWTDPVTGHVSKCDSYFTSWQPEINHKTLKEIIEQVVELAGVEIKHIIISGGEPTMQKELPELCSLLKVLGFHITIETNGTFDFKGPTDLLSISPKLSNSIPVGTEFEEMHKRNRLKLDILRKLVYSFDSYLKFVCTSEKDLEEIKEIQKALQLDSLRIYLMPEGQTDEELKAKRIWLLETCISEGFRYTDRMHIIVYDKKRGV